MEQHLEKLKYFKHYLPVMTNDTSFLRKSSGLPSYVSEVMIIFALEKMLVKTFFFHYHSFSMDIPFDTQDHASN